MNIIPKLSLNKHPKDNTNLSLVNALNIKISNDESCITNEESIYINSIINDFLKELYNGLYKIKGIIPCNTELVLFTQSITDTNKLDIIRYREKDLNHEESIYCAYGGKNSEGNFVNNRLTYHGGEIKGTFTYNVENNLIIAISEYNTIDGELVPLKVINLGIFEETDADNNSDKNLSDGLLSIVPEVKIPNIGNVEYIKGNAYKGWYYLFIRYKINKTDYTQWYPVGYPIYVDVLNRNNIVRYIFNRDAFPEKSEETIELDQLTSLIIARKPYDGYGVGFSDYISDTTDVCNESFKVSIKDLDTNYNIFQIGIICSSKSYTKCYKTFDINIIKNVAYYTLNLKNCEEYNTQDLINTYYNYYNSKNVINYKNRLYIANYNENKINEEEIINSIKNINVGLYTTVINNSIATSSNIREDVTVYKENSNPYQFDESINHINGVIEIPFSEYFSCDDTDLVDFLNNENNKINDVSIKASDLLISTTDENNIININRINGFFAIININSKSTDYSISGIYRIVINNDMSNIKVINSMKIALQLGFPYIKTDKDFINRKLYTTLIPGEVYNFFIHFVDKYGNFTNGYKIDNTFPQHTDKDNNKVDGIVFIIPVPQIEFKQSRLDYIYCSVDKTAKINDIIIETQLTSGYIINDYRNPADHMIRYYANYNFVTKELREEIQDEIREEDYNYFKNILINYVKPFLNQNLNYEFYKIFTFNNNVNTEEYGFDNYINDKGDSLFKVPFNSINVNNHRVYCPYFNNINIPNNYVGYFISYEKFEKRSKYTGLLTINDFRNTDTIIVKNNSGYKDYTLGNVTISKGINNFNTVKLAYGTIYNAKIVNNRIIEGSLHNGIVAYGGGSISGKIIDGLINTATTINGDYTELDIINGNLRIYDNTDDVVKKDSLNTMSSNTMNFYCDNLDIDDTLELDFDFLRIEGKNVFDYYDIPDINYYQRNAPTGFVTDMNKVQLQDYGFEKLYPMPNYKLAVANSVTDNRVGVGTCIVIDNKYDLFVNATEKKNNDINLYRVSLVKDNSNIYNSNNKTLIKFTNVFYNKNNTGIIRTGLNGVYTYSGTIIYADTGVIFNETTGVVTMQNTGNEYYPSIVTPEHNETYENDRPFMCYLQMPIIDTVFHESKCFKNEPKPQVYVVKPASENDTAKYRTGYMVTPANSIDLFKNRQGSAEQFNPKTYTNYRKDIMDIDFYGKTIRRSNVIQDESRENAWREFPLEGYKNITENKGIITNLIGIGTMLLAHTEHSLFMFDTSNELQTVDQSIQLSQPDAFEVDYKEIFTSDLGFGGLQDNNAAIVDQFGYIFYDNSNNHFYQFDNKQLAIIDNDIIQWLLKYKPYNIRFANNKTNNRLLITMTYNVNDIEYNTTLSYNYNIKSFISFHSYTFDKAYNTKSKLYFIKNIYNIVTQKENSNIYSFTNNSNDYCNFNSLFSIFTNNRSDSKISIIINNDFDIIKYLEYISYKLSKISTIAKNADTYSPVEEYKVPFSGNKLIVYNNEINTGELNIEVNDENNKNIFGSYDKPYWGLGNWNFSYLRNKLSSYPTISAVELSRLYGNYFIVEFIFNNGTVDIENEKIEFESLTYKLSK